MTSTTSDVIMDSDLILFRLGEKSYIAALCRRPSKVNFSDSAVGCVNE